MNSSADLSLNESTSLVIQVNMGPSNSRPSINNPRYIPDSPYLDQLLDLDTLDPQTRLLARALTVFDKVRDDYATAPYAESFNLPVVITELRRLVAEEKFVWRRAHFFIAAFRSQIPPSTDYAHLGHLDELVHREALAIGGLIRYWFHTPDANGRNLSTCVWRTQDDARKAGRCRDHQRASSAALKMYKEWRIERYRFDIYDDVKQWEVVEWK